MLKHPQVPHPAELLAKDAKGLWAKLARGNEWLAFKVAAVYGAAITIWVFFGYSLLGVADPHHLTTLLYWGSAVQLVFCGVMTFVGNQQSRLMGAKSDADHQAQSHIAATVDRILEHLGETAVKDIEEIK